MRPDAHRTHPKPWAYTNGIARHVIIDASAFNGASADPDASVAAHSSQWAESYCRE